MERSQIEALATQFIKGKIDFPEQVNPRVQEIVLRIVTDLMQTINDLKITADEYWTGVEFIGDLGKEAGLLSPGLGFDHFMDLMIEEDLKEAGLDGGTIRTIEGPLYVAGAPEEKGFARLDDGTDLDNGTVLFMQGTVYDNDGKPLPNAKVEVWHANSLGNYSFFDESQSDFNLRRSIITDENGNYAFRSIVPLGYSVPPDGMTQKVLGPLGRHGHRPAHIHFFASADGHRKLTTQINIDGDEYLWDDFAFASREGLVPEVTMVEDADKLQEKSLDKPYASIDFDFHLVKDIDKPVQGSEVERRRAQG
ncbi:MULTISPECIES: catechol 1,2-dioxygenase [Psychrobacter]|jgi:catechol 1,2-dioxygenase|uniref:catechol 1,2-dioxygenase n=1 Tax=Psychrobacter TaxID=497 RepID=UPI000EE4CA13|nr:MULTISPECIES: catechol 1,2-dioxygenase [Psychrobacter]MCD1278321.1 catechol 1,2-dioxygenase [Psychrobacter sp. CCUG 69069]HCN18017.1 catechol 1,2-dioxygenase [Psychrobacter sp.]|tara:strand:+ start:1482 stop:2405 length:924 start_codon:yes stop_codon:yes gene_type:complete